MRPEFQALVRLGPLPPDDALDEDGAWQYQATIDALPARPTAEEAAVLIGILPPDDSTSYGMAWSILHAIEASPSWPLWDVLDDRNWWVSHLRDRCSCGGLVPPD